MAQKLGTHACGMGIHPLEVLHACDLFPELFEYPEIHCNKVSFPSFPPYPDNKFDAAYSIEVLKHLHSPCAFISERFRVTEPGGMVIISVPNVPNMASRISYLLHGFFDRFEPLSCREEDAGRGCGQMMPSGSYIIHGMRKAGFGEVRVESDRLKKSSLVTYFAFYPFLRYSIRRFVSNMKSKNSYLYGVNKRELGMMNRRKVCCSISSILVAKNLLKIAPARYRRPLHYGSGRHIPVKEPPPSPPRESTALAEKASDPKIHLSIFLTGRIPLPIVNPIKESCPLGWLWGKEKQRWQA